MWTFLSLLHPLWPMLTQYLNHILLIHWDFFNHISAIYVTNDAYTLSIPPPIYYQNKAIFHTFEFGETLIICPPQRALRASV